MQKCPQCQLRFLHCRCGETFSRRPKPSAKIVMFVNFLLVLMLTVFATGCTGNQSAARTFAETQLGLRNVTTGYLCAEDERAETVRGDKVANLPFAVPAVGTYVGVPMSGLLCCKDDGKTCRAAQ